MKRSTRTRIIHTMLFVTTILLGFALWLYGELKQPVGMLSPKGLVEASEPTPAPVVIAEVKAVADNPQKLDLIIGEAVDEFFTNRAQRSEMRMTMHCLAHRENGHAANRNCGDSGKACGPFQFHQPTWEGYRKIMIKKGLATEIGDRYDLKESARTTAWAISDGRAMAWGPIARDAQGSDYATCQKPSFYKESK